MSTENKITIDPEFASIFRHETPNGSLSEQKETIFKKFDFESRLESLGVDVPGLRTQTAAVHQSINDYYQKLAADEKISTP